MWIIDDTCSFYFSLPFSHTFPPNPLDLPGLVGLPHDSIAAGVLTGNSHGTSVRVTNAPPLARTRPGLGPWQQNVVAWEANILSQIIVKMS